MLGNTRQFLRTMFCIMHTGKVENYYESIYAFDNFLRSLMLESKKVESCYLYKIPIRVWK